MTDKSGKTHKLSRDRQRRDYYSDRDSGMATIQIIIQMPTTTIAIDAIDLKAPWVQIRPGVRGKSNKINYHFYFFITCLNVCEETYSNEAN